MDLIGLLTNIINAVTDIYRGRKGLDTDGLEHEGRLSYEAGISSALAVFQEIQIARDTQIFILAELVYLQQELQFCNETDKSTKNSLNTAIQSFEDALRCLKTVEDPAAYRIAETTYPTDENNRIKALPRDAVHQACTAHFTRLHNIKRSPGINMKEKDVLSQRAANMKTTQSSYMEKQRRSLVNHMDDT